MIMNKLACTAAAAALMGLAACGPGADNAANDTAPANTEATTLPPPPIVDPATQTADFASAVTLGNTLEIETSRIAQTKSTNNDVKAFAAMLVRDHTAAQAKVKTWAAASNATLPATLDGPNQMLLDNIRNADATGFDDKYLDTVIDAHEAAIAKFEAYAAEGGDPALKATAAELLPTLRAHFDRAKTIREAVNAT